VESDGGPAPCDNPSKWVCRREGRATRLPSSSHDTCQYDVVDHSSFSQSLARGAPWDPPQSLVRFQIPPRGFISTVLSLRKAKQTR